MAVIHEQGRRLGVEGAQQADSGTDAVGKFEGLAGEIVTTILRETDRDRADVGVFGPLARSNVAHVAHGVKARNGATAPRQTHKGPRAGAFFRFDLALGGPGVPRCPGQN